jgi:Protein of unknown function (DUF1572)
MATSIAERFLQDVRTEFRKLKEQAEAALSQADDHALHFQADSESNSIAVLVKHLGGNLRSRWTDFLTTDGEKPDRRRDTEFEIGPDDDRASLMSAWEGGWTAVLGTLDALTPADMERTVTIRWEPVPVSAAILRSLTHTAGHVGQIVWLAKHLKGRDWRTLSIPRGQSEEVNRRLHEKLRGEMHGR